jgi:Ca2+-binding RTX toxin-like protein
VPSDPVVPETVSPSALATVLQPAAGDGDDTGSGGGDDTGSGGDDTGSGGDFTGSGGDPLFTHQADSVDFNGVSSDDYLDGTQYDALSGNDYVILPDSAAEASEAGYAPGTLFFANSGDDTVLGGAMADLIDGGNGRDQVYGGEGGDTLFGGNGLDTLFGGEGNDWLSGGNDNSKDCLDGGAGNDTLQGGNGKDTLIGGADDDVLTGGHGRDSFSYSLTADEGDDTITDFESGNGGDDLIITDVVDITGDGAVDIADLDAGGHSVSGTADSVTVTFDSGTSIILAGLDGSGIDSFDDLVSQAQVNVDIL